MKRYRYRNLYKQIPPGNYQFQHEDGFIDKHLVFTELVNLVQKHRSANKLPTIGNLVDVIQDQDCRRVPDGYCEEYDDEHPQETLIPTRLFKQGISKTEVITATRTLVSWVLNGGKKENEVEIQRRIGICVNCQFNVATNCSSCTMNTLRDLIAKVVAGKEYPGDEKLQICYWCGCANKAQTRLPLEALQPYLSDETNAKLPEHCWKKKI